jgi:hypothetical protein
MITDQLSHQIWSQLRSQPNGQQLELVVWGQLSDQLWGQLRIQLIGQLNLSTY